MKCDDCGRDMKSTRRIVTEVIACGTVLRFKGKLCRTCRSKRHATTGKDGVR